MHIKFLAHGRGSASKAAAYVLDSHDHQGIQRAGVEVLRGDPQTFAAIADSLDFKNKYTSGVIAWAKEDEPTQEEINAVLDDFERVAFAGLEPDSYHYCVVMHTEANGAKHVHILIPNVHLTTGKAFNPAPPNWEKTFDPLRDAWNNEKGWARPDDENRARLVQRGHVEYQDAAAARAGLEVEPDAKQLLSDYIAQRVEAGAVTNRAEVVEALAELGEITRQGKDYISVKPEGHDKAIRLKGGLFDERFNPQSWQQAARENQRGQATDRRGREPITAEHRARAEAARTRLAGAIERREKYNRGRYHNPKNGARQVAAEAGREHRPGHGESKQRDQNADRAGHKTADMDDAATVLALAGRFTGRSAGNVASHATRPMERNDDHRNHERQQAVHRNHVTELDDLHNRQKQIPMQGQGVIKNDPARENAIGAVERINRAIQSASDKIGSAIRSISSAIAGNESATGNYDRELSEFADAANAVIGNREGIAEGIKIVRQNNEDEIRRFKQEINLVEYAQVMGYEYDKKQSSKASAVLRKGGEKIIIATDKDGHGMYFNVGDNRDNGSIIDFVQRRQSLNIGQARKVLRPWVSGTDQPTFRMTTPAPKPIATSRDRGAVIASWERLQPYKGNYLQTERKLSEATIAAFGDRIRQDERGNVCFRHIDQTGITGYEVKNRGFTAFATGGEKAVFTCRVNENQPIARVVVVESAVDAMSYHELRGNEKNGTLYLSFAGGMSDRQKQVLRDYLTIEGLTDKAQVIAATDNDAAGHAFAAEIQKMRPDSVRAVPEQAKDWNDMLKFGVLSRFQRVLQQRQAKPPKSDYDSPSLG
jgi:hypothetical protein